MSAPRDVAFIYLWYSSDLEMCKFHILKYMAYVVSFKVSGPNRETSERGAEKFALW
jgi:hypothetical protein